jgi:hypothetical protein
MEQPTLGATQPCVWCERPTPPAKPLCSRDCVLDVRREVDRRVAEFHRSTDPDRRAAIAARNGYLTSALLRSDHVS